MTAPRLMTVAAAAGYCSLTPATFSQWVAAGRMPPPLPGTRRWDRKAIDLALDKASGIPVASVVPEDGELTLAEWKQQNEARKSAARCGDLQPRYHWEDKFDAAWSEWLIQHEVWKATQPPSKHWSPGDIEKTRQGLWTVWKDLKGTRLAGNHA